MTRPSTSLQLGDVITGEPHLYVANPAAPSSDPAVETQNAQPPGSTPLRRFVAAIRRRLHLGPTPEDALAAGIGKAFMP